MSSLPCLLPLPPISLFLSVTPIHIGGFLSVTPIHIGGVQEVTRDHEEAAKRDGQQQLLWELVQQPPRTHTQHTHTTHTYNAHHTHAHTQLSFALVP